MADPATLAIVGIGSSVLGGTLSGVGQVTGGMAKSNMYKYQAGVARVNRDLKIRDAQHARYVGETEAQRIGMKSRFEQGQARATQAGRGFQVDAGTNADVIGSMAEISRHDQATTRANAARRAYGFEVEAAQQGTQAGMYERASSDAERTGWLGGLGSLVSTAGSVAGKWLDASRVGIGQGRGISLAPSPDFPSADIEF